ncbi:stomatal closure-related actin-binding protein 1 isoform X1 [Cinnamomum micranthum f. kanehirae]|uniref:Stomatal closure-related actin-binding protein 1 isoform X1 n=1 Tax=Cinnamomum micranthum f. kanehirae TaxID=337451 RepID=A0A3S4NEB8_9MAGN|nr:stomatal closure-related actin-binding protein 1 isoform X1 [Cinnamomum micranthum f. kanehirae]
MDSQLFASRHVVIIPHPSRSHINAMLNFSKLLASSNGGLHLTFVVTEEWLGLIGSPAAPRNIRLRSIPNVIPSEFVRGADFVGFFQAIHSKMEGPFEELLERLEPTASFILADTLLSWALELGKRREIPVASFWPIAASTFALHLHFHMLVTNGHFPIDTSAFDVSMPFFVLLFLWVVISQMNGQDHPSQSIHVFHVGKMRIKLRKGWMTKAKEPYSSSMQLCGVRGGGNAAAQALFWQAKKGLSFTLAFEAERDRNAAIMLARRYAFDCNIMLAGPGDRSPL